MFPGILILGILSVSSGGGDNIEAVKLLLETRRDFIQSVVIDGNGIAHVVALHTAPPLEGNKSLTYTRIDPDAGTHRTIPLADVTAPKNFAISIASEGQVFVSAMDWGGGILSMIVDPELKASQLTLMEGYQIPLLTDGGDLLLFIGTTMYDFLYRFDGSLTKISERETRAASPITYTPAGEILDENKLLIVWPVMTLPTKPADPPPQPVSDSVWYMVLDRELKDIVPARCISIHEHAEASLDSIELHGVDNLVRSPDGVFLFASQKERSGKATTYRVRFGNDGLPLKRSTAFKRLSEGEYAATANPLRKLGVLRRARGKPMEGLYLVGLTQEGHIYYEPTPTVLTVPPH